MWPPYWKLVNSGKMNEKKFTLLLVWMPLFTTLSAIISHPWAYWSNSILLLSSEETLYTNKATSYAFFTIQFAFFHAIVIHEYLFEMWELALILYLLNELIMLNLSCPICKLVYIWTKNWKHLFHIPCLSFIQGFLLLFLIHSILLLPLLFPCFLIFRFSRHLGSCCNKVNIILDSFQSSGIIDQSRITVYITLNKINIYLCNFMDWSFPTHIISNKTKQNILRCCAEKSTLGILYIHIYKIRSFDLCMTNSPIFIWNVVFYMKGKYSWTSLSALLSWSFERIF